MTSYLAALATFILSLFFWASGFYLGFRLGRRTMLRDLRPYLPEPSGDFRDPIA